MYDELIKSLREATGWKNASVHYSLMNEAADAIEELSGRDTNVPRWIPVTERLPEKANHYLVHIECKCGGEPMSKWTQIAWFCEKFYWERLQGDDVFKETVTHWMPLPQTPKAEEGE